MVQTIALTSAAPLAGATPPLPLPDLTVTLALPPDHDPDTPPPARPDRRRGTELDGDRVDQVGMWLPAQPLILRVQQAGGIRQVRFAGSAAWPALAQSFHRASVSGRIHVHAADRLAVLVLRVHPADVYGEDWWEAAWSAHPHTRAGADDDLNI